MRVLVATSDVPFVEGGHRVIARALVNALRESGHEAEILTTPQNRFGRQFAAYVATRLTDVERTGLDHTIDRLISIRYPSYVLKHPRHVCWLNHRMREYYDLWRQWSVDLGWKGRLKESLRRRWIHSADRYFLKRNVHKVFAQSNNIRQDLLKWGSIPSEVLYPPPPLKGYYTEEYGDFILSPARLTPLKRVPLLLEALARTETGKAVILGEGPDRDVLNDLTEKYSLRKRVVFPGHVAEEELLRWYARCRAVYYAPQKEDYGLVTLEAFHSRKPVITMADSGGPTELVEHDVSGFVLPPDSEPLASAITTLFEDSQLAEAMGAAGYERWKHVNWPETVARLLETEPVEQ